MYKEARSCAPKADETEKNKIKHESSRRARCIRTWPFCPALYFLVVEGGKGGFLAFWLPARHWRFATRSEPRLRTNVVSVYICVCVSNVCATNMAQLGGPFGRGQWNRGGVRPLLLASPVDKRCMEGHTTRRLSPFCRMSMGLFPLQSSGLNKRARLGVGHPPAAPPEISERSGARTHMRAPTFSSTHS